MTQSLYVHFPFCETKCHYCDFYSIGREKTRVEFPLRFETALKHECERWAPKLAPQLDTLFFGGGTPSMTPPESMLRALEPLHLLDRINTNTEWTMEANPSSVDAANLRGYCEIGVNRISMGVQAMEDGLLKLLGRVHSSRDALRALETLFASGFDNVSVDLICGVPDQTTELLDRAITDLLKFPIKHLSCYLLTLPKGNALYSRLPNEDTQLEHLLFIHDRMTREGFRHYEISNFARPGFEARHNLAYWQGGTYLGLGPSAHSYDASQARRWKNVSSLESYAAKLGRDEDPMEWEEFLTPEQKILERWLLALRLDEGFPAEWLESSRQKTQAAQLLKTGFLETHPNRSTHFRLTPRGFALSDQVLQALTP